MRAALLLLAALFAPATQAEIGLNVYGFSYHVERERARQLGVDNELNPGLGLRYRRTHGERLDWILDAGAYRDSGRNRALFAGAGATWQAAGGLRVGGALAAFHSDTYNDGKAFLAPVPIASYDWPGVSLNAVYLPKFSSLNEINTLGVWLTFWPRR